jgi:two-component system nitrogen regulation response regulator GlnG
MSTAAPKLLIVDDASHYVEVAHQFLRGYRYATRCGLPGPCWTCEKLPGCQLTHAHDVFEVEAALAQHSDVDVVLLDVAFDLPRERLAPSSEPDLEKRRRLQGIDILAELRRTHPELPVILMTSEEELAYEEPAAALAVDEYVTLAGADAFDARSLGLLIERVLARKPRAAEPGQFHWGRSPRMARLRRDALVLARTSLPVLLLGESGTGKSALAEQVIHPASRRPGAFLAVDLAALPATLAAAELFGTSRGAFSGATDRRGRFEHAHGGTLLLDEIGNLPPDAQRMLLLALESGHVTRLGETTPRPVDVRLLAATNADLAAAVRAGTFRADLYERLNPAAALPVPPLRERSEDLPELMSSLLVRALARGPHAALLAEYQGAAGLGGADGIQLALGRAPTAPRSLTFSLTAASLRALCAHAWPGNVRELDHLVATAAVFTLADALAAVEAKRAHAATLRILPISAKLVRDLLRQPGHSASSGPGRMTIDLEPAPTLHALSRQIESQVFRQAYEECGGDFQALAARFLTGDVAANARRVRLRFNQLGLRVRRGGSRKE